MEVTETCHGEGFHESDARIVDLPRVRGLASGLVQHALDRADALPPTACPRLRLTDSFHRLTLELPAGAVQLGNVGGLLDAGCVMVNPEVPNGLMDGDRPLDLPPTPMRVRNPGTTDAVAD